jgi:BlaI family transcriptional regulator, penicillinase repressor
MQAIPSLSPVEFTVMKALWGGDARTGSTVSAVRAQLSKQGSDLAYTTVMTLLGRLAAKGAVTVDRAREPFVYKPLVGKQRFARHRLREFLRDVFDDDAGTLVLGLVADESLSLTDLRELETRVGELQQLEAEARDNASAVKRAAATKSTRADRKRVERK